jgi:hypothetical protein
MWGNINEGRKWDARAPRGDDPYAYNPGGHTRNGDSQRQGRGMATMTGGSTKAQGKNAPTGLTKRQERALIKQAKGREKQIKKDNNSWKRNVGG